MADDGKIEATWVGPFTGTLPDGTTLVPGETVVRVGRDEARDSAHWEPAAGGKAPRKGGE